MSIYSCEEDLLGGEGEGAGVVRGAGALRGEGSRLFSSLVVVDESTQDSALACPLLIVGILFGAGV